MAEDYKITTFGYYFGPTPVGGNLIRSIGDLSGNGYLYFGKQSISTANMTLSSSKVNLTTVDIGASSYSLSSIEVGTSKTSYYGVRLAANKPANGLDALVRVYLPSSGGTYICCYNVSKNNIPVIGTTWGKGTLSVTVPAKSGSFNSNIEPTANNTSYTGTYSSNDCSILSAGALVCSLSAQGNEVPDDPEYSVLSVSALGITYYRVS